ncbi:hypothetical protein [Amycolatopsis suaedae]|uniref:Uncharacterized protein n=1 Tax=Amycolatopsis suaedae TaxID=2510978 RepID=A0A4Q7IXY5_9PSEU|nr:hypothetical protein [Amycolatopsis suaedae]RZQ59820.1 hypothetical protein EWH70_32410 [Amycolatopsis suaedae]
MNHTDHDDIRPDVRATARRLLYDLARRGELPAEALDTKDRSRLFAELWERGWTDAEIGVHTKTTTFTVARVRERLGLAPRTITKGAA